MRTPISFIAALLLFACAATHEATAQADDATPLGIELPPEGSLDAEQLEAIADDIRRLEERPFAPDAEQARSHLMRWIMGSSDVHVTLCGGLLSPLLESSSPIRGELLAHFILGSAAHSIENPDATPTDINLGGFQSAIHVYQHLREQVGRRARVRFMDRIAKEDEEGTLREWVDAGVREC